MIRRKLIRKHPRFVPGLFRTYGRTWRDNGEYGLASGSKNSLLYTGPKTGCLWSNARRYPQRHFFNRVLKGPVAFWRLSHSFRDQRRSRKWNLTVKERPLCPIFKLAKSIRKTQLFLASIQTCREYIYINTIYYYGIYIY